ncbi:unnamed protein product, partial [Rotaria sp. Silwood2]
SRTLKQRTRYYQHELIFKNVDHRFTIKQIKNILRQNNISFFAVNVSTSRTNQKNLYVGIRESSLLKQYEEQTQNFFNSKHYKKLQPRHRNSHSSSRHYH